MRKSKLILMDRRDAEMTKYAANAMLATRISFMNSIAQLCEKAGADIDAVRRGVGSDSRIGMSFLFPGAGYGGSCFPKDVRALVRSADSIGYQAELINAVDAVNNRQKRRIFDKISAYFDGRLTDKTIGIWGLSFKPNTDDMRDASSRVLMELLWSAGAKVRAYDPEAMGEVRRLYPNEDKLILCDSAIEALNGADALSIMTEWQEFRSPDFEAIRDVLTHPVVFDGRNLYDPSVLSACGLDYFGIGRGKSIRADS